MAIEHDDYCPLQMYSLLDVVLNVCFFFQAEDGIRDLTVTGVQTCALPICMAFPRLPDPDKKNFWLAAYLIDLAHCVALEGLATKLEAIGAPKSDQVTRSATDRKSVV